LTLPFSILAELDWAADIARRVAHTSGFRDQEQDELVGVAHSMLNDLYIRPPEGTFSERRGKYVNKGFDPCKVPIGGDCEGAFRGWAYKWIWKKCIREGERMRGGGLYITTRPENRPHIRTMGDDAEDLEDDQAPQDCEEPPARAPAPWMLDDLGAHPGRTFGRENHH